MAANAQKIPTIESTADKVADEPALAMRVPFSKSVAKSGDAHTDTASTAAQN